MNDYTIRKVRRNGKNQLFITFKDGECGITAGDYIVLKKITPNFDINSNSEE